MPADVLIVSLGSTHGWRVADAALAESLRRAGASVEVAAAARPPEVRTLALTDLVWALAARRAAGAGVRRHAPRAVLYSTVTAALLGPVPGAVRFDAPAALNRRGRHGVWQRPVERRRLREAPLLVPMTDAALEWVARPRPPAVVVPLPLAVPASPRPQAERDIAALMYAANPEKKGLDRVLAAWRQARRPGEELVVAESGRRIEAPGVRTVDGISGEAYRELLGRSRVYATAPRREDYGQAQLEALAAGCVLVTTAPGGTYAVEPIARRLDPRLVGDDLAGALRTALDDPLPDYLSRVSELLAPLHPHAVDRTVADELLPRLLDRRPPGRRRRPA